MQTFGSSDAQQPASPQASPRIAFRASRELPALLLAQGTISQVAIDPVLAPVPNTKHWFRGVYGMRGTLVPVFDLAAYCGQSPLPMRELTVLVLDPNKQPLGLVCVQAPRVASVVPVEHEVLSDGWQSLSEFLTHPMIFEGEPAFEFNYRHWIARAGSQMLGAARVST